MESSHAREAMPPFSYCNSAKDICGSEIDTYNNRKEKEVQVEIQAIADSSLNSVLLGLSGSLDPQPRYVGLTLGDIPLSTEPPGLAHHLQGSHGHPPSEVPFQVAMGVPHGLLDENNHLVMQELQIIHQSEQQRQLQIVHESLKQQQQQHEQSFHQSAEQQQRHHQQLLNSESCKIGPNQSPHDQTTEMQQKGRRKFSYVDVDHKSAGFLTAWEESVKYMENLRQLQEQHVQNQHQQPVLQPNVNSDQFCLNNMPLAGPGLSATQSFNSFGDFDPVHQENAFPRDKLPADNSNLPSDLYNLPQPSRISMTTSSSCTALGFPGSSVSVQSPGSNVRRPTGPVNSSHSPAAVAANPFSYQLPDRNSSSDFFGTSHIQPPAIMSFSGLSNKLMSLNSVPGPAGSFSKFQNNYNPALVGGSAAHFPSDLPIKPAYSVDQELQLDYGHRNEPQDVFGPPAAGPHGQFLQEIPRRSKSSLGRLLGDLEPKPLHHFATERQRREHLNEKYQMLRSLVPNPTKADRASIVSDAINRIHELKSEEETLLAEKKDRQRRKHLRHEMRSNGKRPRLQLDGGEMDQRSRDEGEDITLRTQWIRKVSEHGTEVEVRVLYNEVEVNIKQIHSPKFLVRIMAAIELGLKLQVLDGSGGVIKNCDIYRFRLKMKGDSCTFIGLIATKILELLDSAF